MVRSRLELPRHRLLQIPRRRPAGRMDHVPPHGGRPCVLRQIRITRRPPRAKIEKPGDFTAGFSPDLLTGRANCYTAATVIVFDPSGDAMLLFRSIANT